MFLFHKSSYFIPEEYLIVMFGHGHLLLYMQNMTMQILRAPLWRELGQADCQCSSTKASLQIKVSSQQLNSVYNYHLSIRVKGECFTCFVWFICLVVIASLPFPSLFLLPLTLSSVHVTAKQETRCIAFSEQFNT